MGRPVVFEVVSAGKVKHHQLRGHAAWHSRNKAGVWHGGSVSFDGVSLDLVQDADWTGKGRDVFTATLAGMYVSVERPTTAIFGSVCVCVCEHGRALSKHEVQDIIMQYAHRQTS